ncbi:hypothetical protein FKM82_014017 [Ascaphus truei]
MTETNQNCCIQFYVLDNTLCSKVIRSGCNEFRGIILKCSFLLNSDLPTKHTQKVVKQTPTDQPNQGPLQCPDMLQLQAYRLLVASTEESAATLKQMEIPKVQYEAISMANMYVSTLYTPPGTTNKVTNDLLTAKSKGN